MGSFMNYAGVVHALKATAEVHRREHITDGEVVAVEPTLKATDPMASWRRQWLRRGKG